MPWNGYGVPIQLKAMISNSWLVSTVPSWNLAIGTSTMSTLTPISFSRFCVCSASFSDTGTPLSCENFTSSFLPSFSRMPSAPAVQPSASRSALAPSGS